MDILNASVNYSPYLYSSCTEITTRNKALRFWMVTLMKFEYVNLILKGWIINTNGLYIYISLGPQSYINRIKEESRFSKSVYHMVV